MADRKRHSFSRFLATTLAVIGLSGPASTQPVPDNIELMGAIAREIMNCRELHGIDWVEVSAIFGMASDGHVNESYGYAYDSKGHAHAAAFLDDAIAHEVGIYREWLRLKGDKGIIKMLFQFNRNTRRVKADFEYDDPLRWQITPNNIDTITDELRPNLGSPAGKTVR